MANSYKLNGNNYIDSTGIIHNKEKLSDILNSAVVLYNNSSGSSENISLSDSVANYTYIEIFGYRSVGSRNVSFFEKVYKPNNKFVGLITNNFHSSTVSNSVGIFTVSIINSSITKLSQVTLNIGNDSTLLVTSTAATTMYITLVIGYK